MWNQGRQQWPGNRGCRAIADARHDDDHDRLRQRSDQDTAERAYCQKAPADREDRPRP